MEEIAEDIAQSTLFTDTPIDRIGIVHCYSTTLSQTLDKHVQATTKEVIERPHRPWFSEGIKQPNRKEEGRKENGTNQRRRLTGKH